MPSTEIDISGMDFSDIDLTDSKPFADRVPHEWFAFLRKNAPVWWQEEADGPGFWAVTSHADCTTVNRDYEHFSSNKKATFIWDLPEDQLVQQQLVMLNMDPRSTPATAGWSTRDSPPGWSTSSTSASTWPPTASSTRSSSRGRPTSSPTSPPSCR